MYVAYKGVAFSKILSYNIMKNIVGNCCRIEL